MIVSGSGFLLYTVLGVIVNVLGVVRFPYPFLTLAADPIFTIGGTLVGLFVVQTAGSLLLYHFLVGFDDEKARFSVLMSFVSLGFGGALLRATLPAALEFLL